MISKSKLKIVKSLNYKKNRLNSNCFVIEGIKGIIEVLKSNYNVEFTVVSKKIYDKYSSYLTGYKIYILEENEIRKASNLKNNIVGFSVVKTKKNDINNLNFDDMIIALDSVNDPGNLGTIIRIADWFNVKNIICSKNTVDLYNPKTIQASMGSFTRVNLYYEDLESLFKRSSVKVYGTSNKNGKNINKKEKISRGIVLFGSESNGISSSLKKYVDHWISINKFGGAESLNVSVSVGIILNEIRKN
tara:strand:- start:158 stop:895 length:738 start_codon:yes stop_codon:yes gene_type:complete